MSKENLKVLKIQNRRLLRLQIIRKHPTVNF